MKEKWILFVSLHMLASIFFVIASHFSFLMFFKNSLSSYFWW
jgi:hypothetical protein